MKGEEIKALRLQLGLTQTELAAEIGVHQVSVARWETGGITPMPIVQQAWPIWTLDAVECRPRLVKAIRRSAAAGALTCCDGPNHQRNPDAKKDPIPPVTLF